MRKLNKKEIEILQTIVANQKTPKMNSRNLGKWILSHVSPQGDIKNLFDDLDWKYPADWGYIPAKENKMGTVEYTFRFDPQREYDFATDENQGYEWEAYKKIEFDIRCPIDAIETIYFESVSGNSVYKINRISETEFEVIIEKISMASILELASLTEMTICDLLALLVSQLLEHGGW